MGRIVGSLALALLVLATPSRGQEGERARCKQLYPPYATAADDAQYIVDPYQEDTWDGRVFASKHSNGVESLDIVRLTIHPGHGWPPHRHFDADEWLYVLSGAGVYAYWALENTEPTEVEITTGHALFNPQSQLHKVWNNGTEPLMLLAVSKSLAPYELLADWPETPDGGVGFMPTAMPWEVSCAPGHEPDGSDDEEVGDFGDAFSEEAGEFSGFFGNESGEFGDDAAEFGGALNVFGDEAGDSSDELEELGDDYGIEIGGYNDGGGCGCAGGEPTDEDAIAECFAEPYEEEDDMAYGVGTEGYGDDADEEGMGFVWGDQDEQPAHVADEL